ncbi:alpha/beta hydrolase family protein [Paenibacillus aestuarii]|uniref:Alpha/beta hydrolase n=1 Tax=Paenibacillus aestuarii TaxID=516965 RepID=A0ABW0KHL4_9BACL|nr:hypothetical protein [Paenibacillus aestuarii]
MSLSTNKRIAVYISAGFATAPNFLDAFAAELASRFQQSGWHGQVSIHFPYGDWSRNALRQLHEIGKDLWMKRSTASGTDSAPVGQPDYGAKSLYTFIRQHASPEEPLLLIGHSGGAVASMQAAELLSKEGREVIGVIQIGSPKNWIPAPWKERVLYIHAEYRRKSTLDPVPWIGSWGGWIRMPSGRWRWSREKHAPVSRQGVSILGGHADYFRDHEPYVEAGMTNMHKTVNAIWAWLDKLILQIDEPINE